jgi:alkanesulfonate monooxygenase SsuD/methylene tetrahydromethanopterin reductase-like flavin-dependent oxidoreductase (luciferase family)
LGGGGEKVTLKLVAKYAQACNVGGGNPDLVRQKLEILRGHCDALGRDYQSIAKSTNLNVFLINPGDDPERATAKARGKASLEEYRKGTMVATPAEVRERVQQLTEAGADYIIAYLPRVAYERERVAQFAEEVVNHFK